MPSPPFRGEREGTRRASDGEGEVGLGGRSGIPHLTPTLSAPKGGEGEFEFSAYRFLYAANIFHDIPVPESDDPITVAGDFQAACAICTDSQRVLSTIELNRKLRRRTGEVHDVSADRVLPTKPAWQLELAQLTPKPPLRFRHISPQPARDSCFPSDDHSISIRTAPYSTGCASATRICAMRPGRCARI